MKGRSLTSVCFALLLVILIVLCALDMKTQTTTAGLGRLICIYTLALILWGLLFIVTYSIVKPKSVSHSASTRIAINLVLATAFMACMFQPSIGLALGIEARLPNFERRELAGKPDLAIKALSSWPSKFEEYFKDNFGFRKTLMGWNSIIRVKYLQSSPTPNVVLGKDNWLFYGQSVSDYRGLTPFTDEQLLSIQRDLEEQRDWLAERGTYYLVVVAPNKETVYPEYLPGSVRVVNQERRLDQLLGYLRLHSNMPILDLREALLQAKDSFPVYYRTDTHWNDYGGFVGYSEIMKQLSTHFPGIQLPSPSDYEVSIEPSHRSGDLSDMLSMHDALVDEETPRVVLNVNTLSNQEKLARAIVIRDSFIVAMRPYLSAHFDEMTECQGANGFDYSMIDGRPTDVVIYELVERSLSELVPSYFPSRAQDISLPPASTSVTSSIGVIQEVIDGEKQFVDIAGWAFIQGYSSDNSCIYVVLQSSSNVYVFDTGVQARPDVSKAFRSLNLNLDRSGFTARIDKGKLEEGTYSVGIYIDRGDVKALRYTDKVLTR